MKRRRDIDIVDTPSKKLRDECKHKYRARFGNDIVCTTCSYVINNVPNHHRQLSS